MWLRCLSKFVILIISSEREIPQEKVLEVAAVQTDGELSRVRHRVVSLSTATAEDGRRPGAGG